MAESMTAKQYAEKYKDLSLGNHLVRIRGGEHSVRSAVMFEALVVIETGGYSRLQLTLDEKVEIIYPEPKFSNSYFKNLIGADPEVFVVSGDGSLIPAFDVFPSKKEAKIGEPYWDGYQAEFAIAPSWCISYVVDHIQAALRNTLKVARAFDSTARLSVRTTMDIPEARLKKDKAKFVNFGCTPSLNAYDDYVPIPPGREVPFRSSGGHLHFQINATTANSYGAIRGHEFVPHMVRELDRILGVISVSMFEKYDDPRRRMLYGRAGEYRITPYGFEYRVLSSAWTIHPAIAHLIYEIARRCIGLTHAPNAEWDVTEEEARYVINSCDVDMARKLLSRNRNGLRSLLQALPLHLDKSRPVTLSTIMEGVHTILLDPDNYAKVWCLDTPAHEMGWISHSEGAAADWGKASGLIASGQKI